MSALFANTILVPLEIGQVPTLQTIGVIDPPRKKRPHSKSRRGCVACKRRRVKCDERLPCSSCVKRNLQCLQPPPQHVIGASLSATSSHFKMDMNPAISLLHLELFHHWDKETRATLAFPQVWPVVMQRAFNEDFIMSAILCVAAMHLATLCPQNTKYSHASMQLIVKTVQLFRKNLSRPFTRDNCEALMGTALLINYISWSDLGFLDDNTGFGRPACGRLNLAQDQLFLLSPGIVRVWFEAMPVFINEGSVFTQLTQQDARLNIERALVRRGEDPTRFVEPFMKMWDDGDDDNGTGCTPATETDDHSNTAAFDGPTSYAWRLLLGLETELLPCRRDTIALPRGGDQDEEQILVRLKDTVTKITAQSTSVDHDNISQQSARSSFEYIARRMSPLLCCTAMLESAAEGDSTIMAEFEADVEQLVFGFPIFCCGPFAQLIPQGDSRALVFLFHFYRAAHILLAPGGRCWWASTRSRVMEEAILKELKCRKIDVKV